MRARLAAMSLLRRKGCSKRIVSRLRTLAVYRSARRILFFWPKSGEPDLRHALAAALSAGKIVLLPRIGRRGLLPVRVRRPRSELERGPFGIRAPRSGLAPYRGRLDLVLVPGLAFDRRKARLGRGKAFFDRFLARRQGALVKIGVAFSFQIVPRLPVAPHDVRMDLVLTDKGLF